MNDKIPAAPQLTPKGLVPNNGQKNSQNDAQKSAHHRPILDAAKELADSIRNWWRSEVITSIEHRAVIEKVEGEAGWTPRYAFMTLMSAGIAILGLLLSSPAVVIGAMLISPLMGPIIGLGFGMALVDGEEIKQALVSLIGGILLAVFFTAAIVFFSPIQDITPEIAARTRPNLFDLLVALFSALAGTYAMIRGREGTVVGVAIATALMPPLAVIGYGLATFNWPVFFGSTMLFVTNLMTIAVTAAVMARLYGFGRKLSARQSGAQALFIIVTFLVLAIPLGLSLRQIAWETNAQRQVRDVLAVNFGSRENIYNVEIDFDAEPIVVRSTVLTPEFQQDANEKAQKALQPVLGENVAISLNQVLMGVNDGNAQTVKLAKAMASEQASVQRATSDRITNLTRLISGASTDDIIIDHDKKRITARAQQLPGAELISYFMLEQRFDAVEPDWDIHLAPPLTPLPQIAMTGDKLDSEGARNLELAIWAASRLGLPVAISGKSANAALVAEQMRSANITVRVTERGGSDNVQLRWDINPQS